MYGGCKAKNGFQGIGAGYFNFKRKKVIFHFQGNGSKPKEQKRDWRRRELGRGVYTQPLLLLSACAEVQRHAKRQIISFKDGEMAVQMVKSTWAHTVSGGFEVGPSGFQTPQGAVCPVGAGGELKQMSDLEQATKLSRPR